MPMTSQSTEGLRNPKGAAHEKDLGWGETGAGAGWRDRLGGFQNQQVFWGPCPDKKAHTQKSNCDA